MRPRIRPAIRHILVCLDRSRFSEAGLPLAISLAKIFGSAITFLHVTQPRTKTNGLHGTDAIDWEIRLQEAERYLTRMAEETAQTSGLSAATRLEQGHPGERITAAARELRADLIVIGSHGEEGVTPWSLGSTVQQVLATAPGSVLVIRHHVGAPFDATLKRVLVPLDGSLRAESVLPTVARISEGSGAEVILAHVAPEPLPTAMLREGRDLELARDLAARVVDEAERYLDRLCGQVPCDSSCVRTRLVRDTDERQSLLEMAEEERVDLVVLSAHGTTCNPARPFGSVTQYLLTHATVPLLVLQDLAEAERIRDENSDRAEESLAPPPRGSFTTEKI